MARWRIAVGAGIVVALAIAVGFVMSSAMPEEPEVAASEPVAGPASATPTVTPDPDPMPELHNTGDDFDEIIRSIEEFRNWLFRHPNTAFVDRIYTKDCPCYAIFHDKLKTLQDDGVRFASNEVVIHEIVLMDRTDGWAALRLVDEGKPTIVVNGHGEVVDEGDGWDPRAYRVLLKRDPDGAWRVSDLDEMALDARFAPYDEERSE